MGCIFHKWDGCKCSKCGKTKDKEHKWDGCKCSVCGKIRDDQHSWDKCKCSVCGETRDADHKFKGCECSVCGKTVHKFKDYVCIFCGIPDPAICKFYKNGNCFFGGRDSGPCSCGPTNHHGCFVKNMDMGYGPNVKISRI